MNPEERTKLTVKPFLHTARERYQVERSGEYYSESDYLGQEEYDYRDAHACEEDLDQCVHARASFTERYIQRRNT